MCILLAEDDFLIRLILVEVLRDSGFEVREAESADAAVELIESDPAALTLLVTDIHMPGQLDGIDLGRRSRELRPDMPVVYTTGRPDILRHAGPLGEKEALLVKPFASSDLLAVVRRLLASPTAAVTPG